MGDAIGSGVGFLGLGVMGRPMAARLGADLVAGGRCLAAWNRTPGRGRGLPGVLEQPDVDSVFDRSATIFAMLRSESATDAVLGRGTAAFAHRMRGRLLVSTGTTAPDYARALAADVRAAGGGFLAVPVSGSRGPAEAGTLLALAGGTVADLDRVRELLAPMTRAVIHCGDVGSGLRTKLAVNHYLTVMVATLAETVHLADRLGVGRELLAQAVTAGPMASEVARAKLTQLATEDFAVRATVAVADTNVRLVQDAARAAAVATPLLDLTGDLFTETVDRGLADLDMIAVLRAIEQRTVSQP